MDAQSLARTFSLNHQVIKTNTEGLSHEDSLRYPEPGGNCLNWVVGHIVAARNSILELLGAERIWTKEESAPYARGTKPIPAADARPLAAILADLDRSQERLSSWLERASTEDLERAAGDSTVGEKLAFLQFHETYHAGQTGLLRRLLGRTGAIA